MTAAVDMGGADERCMICGQPDEDGRALLVSGTCRRRLCRRTCWLCLCVVDRKDGLRRLDGRCTACGNVHVLRAIEAGATVHPTARYANDPAAQLFVAEHPSGATLEEVGEALGITKEATRTIETRALDAFLRRAQLVGISREDLAAFVRAR